MRINWTPVIVVAIILVFGIWVLKSTLNPVQEEQASQGVTPPTSQDLQGQIVHLESIIKSDPQNVIALIELGNLYYDSNQPQKAVTNYEKALKIDSQNPSVWTDLGTMYRTMNNIDKSIECFEKALKLKPDLITAWFNLGVVYKFDKNDDRKALPAWKKYLTLAPPDDPHTQMVREQVELMEKALK